MVREVPFVLLAVAGGALVVVRVDVDREAPLERPVFGARLRHVARIVVEQRRAVLEVVRRAVPEDVVPAVLVVRTSSPLLGLPVARGDLVEVEVLARVRVVEAAQPLSSKGPWVGRLRGGGGVGDAMGVWVGH